jgi:hypothetical protein
MNDQAYFWTYDWQRDEAESLADLKAGRARTFDNPQDAVAWLKAPLTHRFCEWDAGPDLAQATWEWPPKRRQLYAGANEFQPPDLDWVWQRIRDSKGL